LERVGAGMIRTRKIGAFLVPDEVSAILDVEKIPGHRRPPVIRPGTFRMSDA
jgi:hypothetical protein